MFAIVKATKKWRISLKSQNEKYPSASQELPFFIFTDVTFFYCRQFIFSNLSIVQVYTTVYFLTGERKIK